jgi:hypothetical protein
MFRLRSALLIFFLSLPLFFPGKIIAATEVFCPGETSINTALGCIPVEMDKFMAWILPYLFGIAGTIAFLLMIYGFILIGTSQGDPKALQGAKETVTSAIMGLLVSLFAIFILRLITLNILVIPGIS